MRTDGSRDLENRSADPAGLGGVVCGFHYGTGIRMRRHCHNGLSYDKRF